MKHPRVLAFGIALCLAAGPVVFADSLDARGRVRDLVVLLGNSDLRLRVQACLSLGRVGSFAARPPLERALRDVEPAVRAAAAVGLARLGDPAALPSLRRAQMDRVPVVRQQIDSAIRALGSANAAGTDWAVARVAIGVGQMANRTQVSDENIQRRMRELILAELRAAGTIALMPDAVDRDFERRVAERRLHRYFVEGTVSRFAESLAGDSISIRCEVSLVILTDPGRDLRMILSGAATSHESGGAFSAARANHMRDQALEGAVRSASSRLLSTLLSQTASTLR